MSAHWHPLLPCLLRTAAQTGAHASALLSQPVNGIDQILAQLCSQPGQADFALHFGRNFVFDFLPDMDTFLLTCESLRQAARALHWVNRLLDSNLILTLEEVDGWAVMTVVPPVNQAPSMHADEAILAAVTRILRTLTAQQQLPVTLYFRHRRPAHAERYTALLQAPCEFGAGFTGIRGPAEWLDRPLPNASAELNQTAEHLILERMLADSDTPVSDRLRALLHADHSRLALNADAMAESLGLHPRTLQRRLAAEGQSWTALVDEVRFHWTLIWLRQRQDLEDIALRLGFADRRCLTRAFRRWTGHSPREWLSRHLS
ncbi:AraC family transcriptional regulator ligand-binding domain-containing protein [Hahella sp. SMD15-11]|uniref:AraC family transcriptional regulator ligand-binding domain-containing protein n=1 Tax=Thermohahella caldifontis TaxID=3142973 RepID=A0AB39UTL8_9GAMM